MVSADGAKTAPEPSEQALVNPPYECLQYLNTRVDLTRTSSCANWTGGVDVIQVINNIPTVTGGMDYTGVAYAYTDETVIGTIWEWTLSFTRIWGSGTTIETTSYQFCYECADGGFVDSITTGYPVVGSIYSDSVDRTPNQPGTTAASRVDPYQYVTLMWYSPIVNAWTQIDGPDLFFRCDDELRPGKVAGCIDPSYGVAVEYHHSSNPELTDHVWQAQQSGLPGEYIPLHRIGPPNNTAIVSGSSTLLQLNRARACGGVSGGPITYQCDEYPFASTYEGAYTQDPSGTVATARTQPGCYLSDPIVTGVSTGWSRCMISGSQNASGGAIAINTWTANRVLDNDPFWVYAWLDYVVRSPSLWSSNSRVSLQGGFATRAASNQVDTSRMTIAHSRGVSAISMLLLRGTVESP